MPKFRVNKTQQLAICARILYVKKNGVDYGNSLCYNDDMRSLTCFLLLLLAALLPAAQANDARWADPAS